ncbi:hypothetical protein ACRRTK_019301 [Alexandromys fortis]
MTAYYRGAMGIMLVYDITNEKSFDNIRNWIQNIEEHASADVEKMILGNKCDMNDKRQVSKEQGEKLALDYGIKFMECEGQHQCGECIFQSRQGYQSKNGQKIGREQSAGEQPRGQDHSRAAEEDQLLPVQPPVRTRSPPILSPPAQPD